MNSEQHGKRGKMELMETKTGLEEQGSKSELRTTWKAWTMDLKSILNTLEIVESVEKRNF